MKISLLDWSIIIAYFVFSLGIGLYYRKRAGRSINEFFLTGRNLPWWIAGTAMVATTFAADTPLAVTELVAKNGIAGNWLWWNFLFGGMLTVFFFARLWRRAGILTDVEFAEIRYSGKPAAFLRGFRAFYLGLLMNTIIMGWVNLAMEKIIKVTFPGLTIFGRSSFTIDLGFWTLEFSSFLIIVGLIMVIVSIYSSLSGLWGVAVTDAFQFVMAMGGCIVLAVIAINLPEIGGISGLQQKLPAWTFEFLPKLSAEGARVGDVFAMTFAAFIAYIGIQWWASWYPGAEPGGGGYVAQRMMSAKNEKHSLFATLWFIIAHYCLRPWPWIIVGLVSVVLYPDLPLAEKGDGFIMVMRDFLPAGLLGLLLAAFFAAYMSTIATQLNWGTSYIINDYYKRFYKKEADERHYVFVSRITTILIMVISLVVTSKLQRISDAWQIIIQAGAGIGLVLILRWFWWRINAWSEITALIVPFPVYFVVKNYVEFPYTLFYIVGVTTASWILVTFLTPPTDDSKLLEFYRKIHPGGIGWKKISDRLPEVKTDRGYFYLFLDWFAGCVVVYFTLFGFGKLIFAEYISGFIYLIVSFLALWFIFWDMQRREWEII